MAGWARAHSTHTPATSPLAPVAPLAPTRSALPGALVVAALAALAAALALTITGRGTLAHPAPLYRWYTVDAALFALALLLLRRVPDRQVVPLVLAGSVVVAALGLLAPPRTSDDAYRYVWDGRVQAAGISPYAYPPDDPALARLRDPQLFPVGGRCDEWDERRTAAGDCTRINRPAVHTIYPPVAEAWFLAVHPWGGGIRGAQAAGALLAVATTGGLLWAGRGAGGRRCGGGVRASPCGRSTMRTSTRSARCCWSPDWAARPGVGPGPPVRWSGRRSPPSCCRGSRCRARSPGRWPAGRPGATWCSSPPPWGRSR